MHRVPTDGDAVRPRRVTRSAVVLTHHSVPNFGANLQAFATSRALQERNIVAQFVDFRPPELEAKYSRTVPEHQHAVHADFVKRNLWLSTIVIDQPSFEALCRAHPADLYVSGSDAVFRLDASSERADLTFPNPYWLIGAVGPAGRPPIKAALAPSAMGCNFKGLPALMRRGMREALQDFTLLSARDAWTVGQISSLGIGQKVALVADPVFTLAPLLRDRAALHNRGRPYIVVSTQGRKTGNWVSALTRLAAAEGYDTLALPTPEGQVDSGTTRTMPLPLDPLDWATLITGASGYVGARFHPVVISLMAGNAVVALDMYHSHPFRRARSKTWQIMCRFGVASACHSSVFHKLLTPAMVWAQLQAQMRDASARRATAAVLAAEVNTWYDRIANATRSDAL